MHRNAHPISTPSHLAQVPGRRVHDSTHLASGASEKLSQSCAANTFA